MKSYLIFLSCFLAFTSLWGQRQPSSNPIGSPGILQTYSFCQERDCPRTNKIVLTTGLDANGDLINPALGAVDPNWRLINNPPLVLNNCISNWLTLGPSLNGDAYIINYDFLGPTAWANQAGAGTLGPVNGGENLVFGCNNAINPSGIRVPYIFERQFCICTPAMLDIDFTFKGDDQVSFQLINLNTGAQYFNPVPTGSFQTLNSFSFVGYLPWGQYALRAYLVNTWSTTLGFSLKGEINAAIGAPFLTCASKCKSNTLVIAKVLDTNCDGTLNAGEQVGEGWEFDVLDANGNTVKNGLTDENGNLIINNIPTGMYQIIEHSQVGWAANQPAGGEAWVEVKDSLNQITFYNCPSDGQNCCPGTNLIVNGNFESGNLGFSSDYDFVPANDISSFWINDYSVVDASQASLINSQWNIDDHSTSCDGAGNFYIANGQTDQNADQRAWYQDGIPVNDSSTYSFCLHKQNLLQCAFDLEPEVYIKVFPAEVELTRTACDETLDACGWTRMSWQLKIPTGVSAIAIEVWMDEQRIGDGNDLALDDISLQELNTTPASFSDFNLKTTSVNTSGEYQITATAISLLAPGYNVAWVITDCSVDNDMGWENAAVIDGFDASNQILLPASNWNGFSTTFPGYEAATNSYATSTVPGTFQVAKRYCIWRIVWNCCSSYAVTKIDIRKQPNLRLRKSATETNKESFELAPAELKQLLQSVKSK